MRNYRRMPMRRMTASVIAVMMAVILCACGGNDESNSVFEAARDEVRNANETNTVSDVTVTEVSSGTESPDGSSTEYSDAEDGEDVGEDAGDTGAEAIEYWYIDNMFRDAVGHEFVFSEPDAEGTPTKITISNWSEEYDGTYEFEFMEGSMLPAEYDSEPWILGAVKGIKGILGKKDLLMDDNGRTLGVDIYGE